MSNFRLKWVTSTNRAIFPNYTKKCWVITKIPCGDLNLDDVVDIVDVVYLINYVFYSGPAPVVNADVNSDDWVDIKDVVILINYIFYGGVEPNCQ
jgi:hypothetical protein